MDEICFRTSMIMTEISSFLVIKRKNVRGPNIRDRFRNNQYAQLAPEELICLRILGREGAARWLRYLLLSQELFIATFSILSSPSMVLRRKNVSYL